MRKRAIGPERDYRAENPCGILEIAKTQLQCAVVFVCQGIVGTPLRDLGEYARSLIELSEVREGDTQIETRLHEIGHELCCALVRSHRIGQAPLVLANYAERIQEDRSVGSCRERLADQPFRFIELAAGVRHQAKLMQCLRMAGSQRQGAKTISLCLGKSPRFLVHPRRGQEGFQ